MNKVPFSLDNYVHFADLRLPFPYLAGGGSLFPVLAHIISVL
jgi:hypothetical protein